MDIIKLISTFAEYTPGLLGWGIAAFLIIACWKQNKDNIEFQQASLKSVSSVVQDNTEALTHLKVLLEERTVKRLS